MNFLGGEKANQDMDYFSQLMKLVFGDVPIRGALRLIVIGALLAATFFTVRDWKEAVERRFSEESAAVRATLTTSIASNEAWKNASMEERAKLLRKANARLRRLYEHNSWQYEDIEP